MWLLLLAAAPAAVWAIAQQLGWPVPVRAVLAALAALAVVIVPELRNRLARGALDRSLLNRLEILPRTGRLPFVREVRLTDLRVHEALVPAPYVPRDAEECVDDALRNREPLLIVGHSMSGKTRLAAQRVQHWLRDAPLLAPASAQALRDLVDARLNLDGVVVWLDDLQRFLAADQAFSLGLLEQIVNGGATVVATIRRSEYETFRPTNLLHPPQWEVLRRFRNVELKRALTSTERDRAHSQIDDPTLLTAIDRYGLAEYLGGGPLAIDRFESGETESPVGQALARAAVDWRRAGLVRRARRDDLVSTLPAYLRDRTDVSTDAEAIDRGLAWACQRINETVALLTSHESRGEPNSAEYRYEAFDYLVDHVVNMLPSEPIPIQMWHRVIEAASVAEEADVQRAVGQLFVGQTRVLAELAAWMTDPTPSLSVLTIVGAPWSGKTSVLARLAVLADPAIRRLVPVDPEVPQPAIPPLSLSTTGRKTARELFGELIQAAGAGDRSIDSVPTDALADVLLGVLAQRREPFIVTIDGLDESPTSGSLVQMLEEVSTSGTPVTAPARILVSTRPVATIRGSRVIAIDPREMASSAEIVNLVRTRLLRGYDTSDVALTDDLEDVTKKIAEASRGNPIFAMYAAEMFLSTGQLPARRVSTARACLASGLAAMDQDREAALLLLTVLATRDAPLTVAEWSHNVAQSGSDPVVLAEFSRLVALLEKSGLVTTQMAPAGDKVYVPFHAALRDYLLSG